MFRRDHTDYALLASKEHTRIDYCMLPSGFDCWILLQQCDSSFHHWFCCIILVNLNLLLHSRLNPHRNKRKGPAIHQLANCLDQSSQWIDLDRLRFHQERHPSIHHQCCRTLLHANQYDILPLGTWYHSDRKNFNSDHHLPDCIPWQRC